MSALKIRKKEKQINLLPQDKLTTTVIGKALIWFLSTFRILVIVIELLVVSAFLSRFWLDSKNTDLSESLKQKEVQIKAMKKTEEEIKQLQQKTEIIKQILSTQKTPSKILKEIVTQIPQEITLSSISITEDKISLSGISSNELAISQFLTNLKTVKEFQKSSLSRISQEKEDSRLNFNITIPIK